MSKTEYMREVAAELRAGRMAMGLSQAEMAERMKVSPSTISNWESAIGSIPAFNLDAFRRFVSDAAARQLAAKSYAGNAKASAKVPA